MNRFPAWSLAGYFTLLGFCAAPALAEKPPLATRALSSCAAFDSAQEIWATLEALAKTHPEMARVEHIGLSVQGRPIMALFVGRDHLDPLDAVSLRVLGALHGNECLSAQTTLDLAVWLVTNATKDPLAQEWAKEAVTVFVPLANPDGYCAPKATRSNAAGVDLNRDLPFARLASDGPAFSQPETRALRALDEIIRFHLGVELHTVEQYINSPWNHTPHLPPDEALLLALMKGYAGDSGYQTTFGWHWYGIYGDINDWSYGTVGTLDFAVELRSDFTGELELHASGLASLVKSAQTAIVGTVRDADTLAPLTGRIELHPEGAPVFTNPQSGAYRRIVLPGQYEVIVHSPGYAPQSASATVALGTPAVLDFELQAALDGPVWAFAVTGTVLPLPVPKKLTSQTYLDDSLAFDALGPTDGIGYSLKPGGEITLDLGVVAPTKGASLQLKSSTGSDDRVAVSVALEQDGPFTPLGEGVADFDLDLHLDGHTPGAVRFIRLTDLTNDAFNTPSPGYDLDAVALVWSQTRPRERTTSRSLCQHTATGAKPGSPSAMSLLLRLLF